VLITNKQPTAPEKGAEVEKMAQFELDERKTKILDAVIRN
jgi:hypothetical protein